MHRDSKMNKYAKVHPIDGPDPYELNVYGWQPRRGSTYPLFGDIHTAIKEGNFIIGQIQLGKLLPYANQEHRIVKINVNNNDKVPVLENDALWHLYFNDFPQPVEGNQLIEVV